MRVIFHEDFYQVYTSDPAAAMGRLEAITAVITPSVDLVEATPATETDIVAVHTELHIKRVKQLGVYAVAALAAGGAIQAATIGLSEPCFGLIRPPGHHASSDGAWGFCYFNNMAIAIEHLRRKQGIERAYVLDIDLHFGDGTVNILKGKEYVHVHNVAAKHRLGYLAEVKDEMDNCEADIIGVSAGFDNHEDDWGGTLSTEDFRDIGRMVRGAANRVSGGCFAILEGGYNHQVLGYNVLALIEGLSAS
jgi:acetoin utilization deacetylase AcuC-like enzyme